MDSSSTVGPTALRAWRADKGFRQRELAALLGAGEARVSQWESGRAKPTLTQAIRLARLTGIAPDSWEVES
jgi:transcriptional regulator with XRE-family HTH domain